MIKVYATFYCSFFVVLFIATLSLVQADSPLDVHNPWVLEAPPGMKVMAAYMTLKNDSAKDLIITTVSSPSFNRVEMHKTVMDKDKASMIKQDTMTVKAGQDLLFKPGGSHLMLIGPKKPLKSGESIDIKLTLRNGEYIIVTAPVRKFNDMQQKKGGQSH